jgi:hypothetical protein
MALLPRVMLLEEVVADGAAQKPITVLLVPL